MTTLNVNGRPLAVDADPSTPVLWALRDNLGLTGTKFGCGAALCGACTVHMDGRTVNSCSVLAIEAEGHEIATVESLDKNGHLHAVQEAFIECDGLQCGFCTPGFVMASVALLRDNPHPSQDEIRRGLSGNICRCGTQDKALKAVQKAAGGTREGRD